MGDPAALRLRIPKPSLHARQRGTDRGLQFEQPDCVEEHAQLEREMTANRYFARMKAQPVVVRHEIHQDPRLVIPEDPVLGVPGSVIADDFEDATSGLFFSTLPAVIQGLVNGVLGE